MFLRLKGGNKMITPIHMMLMTNHLVQQNQMMMLRHRQQQARNAAVKSKLDNEREVAKMKKCPVCDVACPYINRFGECTLDNPAEECDEFAYYDEDEDDADETGFDPYLGCYTDDC
jgi:hypothetical protein